MKYQCGMYGGTFSPLHLGHVRCIIEAANQCDDLIIVISEGVAREEVDMRIRYRWIYQLTKHIGNVRLFVLTDDAITKQAYTEDYWLNDAQKVKNFASKKIDAVFCGSDYNEESFWAKGYPDSKIIFMQRNEISSTKIREDVMKHWDWLPNIVKPYYTKKVLLVGGESTGKSTLAINLANYYNTNYLEEVGRDISERSGTDLLMLPEDFTDILLQHKVKEKEAILHSNKILFEDTDCLITKFYIQFLDGIEKKINEQLADAIAEINSYDLILFLEPDVKFVQDGDRSLVIEANRNAYSNKIMKMYKQKNFNLQIISGDYQDRFEKAVYLIDELLGGRKYGNERK